jgi:hypothetical protein
MTKNKNFYDRDQFCLSENLKLQQIGIVSEKIERLED